MWKSNVGQLLREKAAKEGRDIEQQELARAIGVEENTVSRWVRGVPMKTINAHTVRAYCQYFGVGFSDVVELIEEGDESPERKAYIAPLAIPA